MNLPVLQTPGATMTNGRIAKFVYPSGSRPLDGFTLKCGIGRGGFGEVYYAVSDAGKDVALKLIQRSHDVELRGVRQCLNFRHPHLVEIYDIRESESGDWWIVMEYVAGDSLQATLEKSPNGFSTSQALDWIRGATAGVAGLHERGVVHRDLKPGNIFRSEGAVKIGDYGLSKFISASRRSAQTESIGTIHYMAPEVAGGRYGREIDVYALGVILYEMLAGKLPFEGESLAEILMKHLSATPDLSPLPAAVRGVVGRSLAKDPKQRYSTALEFSQALEAALAAPVTDAGRIAPAFLGGVVAHIGSLNGQPANPALAANATTPKPARAFESTIGHAKPIAPAVAPPAVPLQFAAHPAAPNAVQPAPAYAAGPATPSVEEPQSFDDQTWPRIPREPLWVGLTAQWERLDDFPIAKAALIAGVVLTLPIFAWAWALAAWIYIVYFAVWSAVAWIIYAGEVASRSAADAIHEANASRRRRPLGVVRPATWRGPETEPQPSGAAPGRATLAPLTLPKKSFVRWAGELSRSCFSAAGISAAITLAWGAAMWKQVGHWPAFEHLAALAVVGAVGSWMVLTVSKFWEGRDEDPFYRRIMLGASGLAVGAFAYLVELGFMIGAPTNADPTTLTSVLGGNWQLFGAPTGPSLLSSMAYFGFLFAVMKWWNQVDPLRRSRFSLWRIVGAAFWAVLLDQVWPFPEPWGVLWAVMIALAVQSSSPWQLAPVRESQRQPIAA